MKTKRYILVTSLAAALLLAFSACSQDELSSPVGEVEEAVYPLKIGNVSIVAQSSEEPWTRVAESSDGNNSVWQENDKIGVRLEGATYSNNYWHFISIGQYYVEQIVNGNVSLSPVEGKEVYWRNKYAIGQNQNIVNYGGGVTAWYPDETAITLSDQSNGLTYVMKGESDTDENMYFYDDAIPLTFTHQLAKVRVALEGERVSQVTKVEVYGYTSCTNTQGTVTTEGASQGWITMHHPTEYGDGMYWEANLVPGTIQNNFVRLNGTTEVPISTLTNLVAGNLHTVTVDVRAYPSDATQITAANAGNISGNGNYYVTSNLASAINITGGSPHIYLYNANVTNSAGSAISITNGAKPTIHVVGENTIGTNESYSNRSAGIYVAEGSSITIEGNGTDDVLRVTGGVDGAAIGGYRDSGDKSCGDIVIKNVTLYAYAIENYILAYAPGIGATGGTCGRIEISSAIVYARSNGDANSSAPPIGAYGSVPEIVITDSEIHAYRGSFGTSYADYIGRGGDRYSYQGGQIQCGSGSIIGSTIYKYTYKVSTGSSSSDGSVTF